MEAAGEELVPAVDCCLLRLVHQDELLRQTQAAGVVARLEGGGARQDPPLDVGLDPLILEGPNVPGEFGLDPLLRVLEVRLMVGISGLPLGRTDTDILHDGLVVGSHLRLIDDPLVHAPAPLHHADRVLAPAVAVRLPIVGCWGGDLGVVAGHQLAEVGHCPGR